jgi:hypothetical protein
LSWRRIRRGICRRACDSGEDVVRYNLRNQIAFRGLSLRGQAVSFDLDSYKLVVKALMGQDGRSLKVIELDAVGAPDVLMP